MKLIPRRLVATALVASRAAFAIPTIEVKGSKFFTSEGNQFFIKGVAYQSSVQDLNNLTNGPQCKIDAKLIADMGANVVRVYTVDPTLNHDDCMKAFADQGIYVLLDMAAPMHSINRVTPEWTTDLRDEFAKVIDGFQQYDNLLGFFASNEVVNDNRTTAAAPYVKAVVADMKAYRDLMQYRKIPIGYSASDVEELQDLQQDYFDCGSDKTAVDFYAFNKYSWCGSSSMSQSGYDKMYSQAEGFDIPIFLSETGCMLDEERDFGDQVAILGRDMNDRFSGSIIYEWAMEENGYGIVSYQGSSATGTPLMLGDYSRLKSQWATLSPNGIKESAYDPTLTKRDCPAFTSGTWLVQKDDQLPTVGTSGLTAPTAPRSSTARETGTKGAGLAGADTSAAASSVSSNEQSSNNSDKSSTPVGAIAGGVLGGLVVLGLILGAVLFILRRKKKQRAAVSVAGDNGASGGESDKMVVTDEERKVRQNGYYGPNYHELSGNGRPQELDPERGQAALWKANEMPSGYTQHTGELPDGQSGDHSPTPPFNKGMSENAISAPAVAPEPSAHVAAQRRREMEWLESEEEKLRQRREQLMRQVGRNGG